MPTDVERYVAEKGHGGAVDYTKKNKRKKKRSRKKKSPGAMGAIHYAFADRVAPIVGADAPRSIVALAASMYAAGSQGGKHPVNPSSIVLGLYNAGWRHESGSWEQTPNPGIVFADAIAKDGKVIAFRMPKVAITSPGSWTGSIAGRPATLVFRSDIDDHIGADIISLPRLARDTNAVLDELKPPMTLDHPQKRRGPAFGWNKEFYVDDDGILRTKAIDYIPPDIARLIERKQYRRLSPGIRPNYQSTSGTVYPWVVDHTAILGASTPAMKSLEDIPSDLEALYAASERDGDVWLPDLSSGTEEGENMPDPKAQGAGSPPSPPSAGTPPSLSADQEAIVAKMIAEALKGANDTIAALKAENEESKKKIDKMEAEDLAREAKDLVATYAEPDAQRRVRLLPASRQRFERLAHALSVLPADHVFHFSENNEQKAATPITLLRDALESLQPVLVLGQKAPMQGDGGSRNGGDEVAEFSDEILEKMGTTRERVTDALKKIRENKGTVRISLDPSVASLGL